jgi:hypothetical protein
MLRWEGGYYDTTVATVVNPKPTTCYLKEIDHKKGEGDAY